MNKNKNNISIDDLVAYADGQLEAEREREVANYLYAHPEAIPQVEAYRQQSTELHRHFDPVLSAPIPKHLLPPERVPFTLGATLTSKFSQAWGACGSCRGLGRLGCDARLGD